LSSTPPLLQQIIIFSLCCNEKVNETMHKNKNNEKLFEHYCLKFLVIFLFKGLGLSQICIYRSVVCICNLHIQGRKLYMQRGLAYTDLNLAIQIHLFSKKECRGTPASVKFWCVVTKLLQSYYIRQNVITL
jgi:hypothetical protein